MSLPSPHYIPGWRLRNLPLLNWSHSLPLQSPPNTLRITKPQRALGVEIIKGILFFWCRAEQPALMSIIHKWFWKSSSLICVRINYYLHPAVIECLTITWLTTTWMSWIQLILLFPGRGGREQSLVSDFWWLWWLWRLGPSLTKTFRMIICIRGHHFIQETPEITNNRLENNLELTLMI